MGSLTITLEVAARGPAAAFVLGEEQAAVIGEGAKRFPARAEVNGTTLQGTVTRMRGEFLFGLSRAVRESVGLAIGEEVTVTITRDDAPRTVEVPPALAAALEDDGRARTAFEALAFTHRKELARWIAEAKRAETRDRRVQETVTMLHAGRTRS